MRTHDARAGHGVRASERTPSAPGAHGRAARRQARAAEAAAALHAERDAAAAGAAERDAVWRDELDATRARAQALDARLQAAERRAAAADTVEAAATAARGEAANERAACAALRRVRPLCPSPRSVQALWRQFYFLLISRTLTVSHKYRLQSCLVQARSHMQAIRGVLHKVLWLSTPMCLTALPLQSIAQQRVRAACGRACLWAHE